MNTINAGPWVENLTWPEIEKRIARGAFAILPIGAASKEHGRHLPLNTDYLQAKWLADQVAKSNDVLIWPIVSYGYYPVFVDYPGSISINANSFATTINEIIDGIVFAGLERVIILNTGISTILPLKEALAKYERPTQVRLHNVYSGANYLRATKAIEKQVYGGHADEIETSLMLALDESLVDLAAARNPVDSQAQAISRGLFNRLNPEQANYSPDGVNGDPTLATKEKGVLLLEALRADCLSFLED